MTGSGGSGSRAGGGGPGGPIPYGGGGGGGVATRNTGPYIYCLRTWIGCNGSLAGDCPLRSPVEAPIRPNCLHAPAQGILESVRVAGCFASASGEAIQMSQGNQVEKQKIRSSSREVGIRAPFLFPVCALPQKRAGGRGPGGPSEGNQLENEKTEEMSPFWKTSSRTRESPFLPRLIG